ncbi:MAG: hypothetical protein AAGC43_14135 [Bacteroidota bacterium]
MKKLAFMLTMVIMATLFFSCNKDDDSYYPFDDERELSVDQNDIETNSSED